MVIYRTFLRSSDIVIPMSTFMLRDFISQTETLYSNEDLTTLFCLVAVAFIRFLTLFGKILDRIMEVTDISETAAATESFQTSFDLTTGSVLAPALIPVESSNSTFCTPDKLVIVAVPEDTSVGPCKGVIDLDDHDDVIDRTFDTRLRRTFTIRKMHFSEQKKYVASAGMRTNKSVLVIEIVSPIKVNRIISVSGENARLLHEWFL